MKTTRAFADDSRPHFAGSASEGRRLFVAAVCLALGLAFAGQPVAVGAPSDHSITSVDAATSYLQGPTRNAVSKDDAAVPPLTRAWRRTLPGLANYPVVGDGRVFVTSGVTGWVGTFLFAYDAVTGARLWGPVDLGGVWISQSADLGNEVGLAYDAGTVFVTGYAGGISGYDAVTGHRAWTRFEPHLTYAQPAPQDGVLYFLAGNFVGDGYVEAISETDGSLVWRVTSDYLQGQLAVGPTALYLGDACGNADALDLATGAVLWRHRTGCEGPPTSPPVEVDGSLYVGSPPNPQQVLDVATGAVIGTFTSDAPPIVDGTTVITRSGSQVIAQTTGGQRLWSYARDPTLSDRQMLVGSTLYVASGNGTLYGFDELTGSVTWTGPIPPASPPIGSRPALAAGSGVLLVPSDRQLIAFVNGLAPNAGHPLVATAPPPASAPRPMSGNDDSVSFHIDPAHDGALGSDSLAPPLKEAWTATMPATPSYPLVVAEGVFVTAMGSDGHYLLYGLALSDGHELWQPIDVDPEGARFAAAAYENGTLFVLAGDGELTAVAAATGAVLWAENLATSYGGCEAIGFGGAPTASGGSVYLAGTGICGLAYAVDEATGVVRWLHAVTNGFWSAPAVSADGVFFAFSCRQDEFDPATGVEIWEHSAGCEGAGGSAPSLYNGVLYARDMVWANYAIPVGGFRPLGGFSTEGIPAFSGSSVYYVLGGALRAERGATVLWTFPGDGGLVTGAIVVNGVVYVGSSTGNVYGVDPSTGAQRWLGSVADTIPADEFPGATPSGLGAGHGLLVVPGSSTLTAFASA